MISCCLGTSSMALVAKTDRRVAVSVSVVSVCLGVFLVNGRWEQDINKLGLNKRSDVRIYPLEEMKKHRSADYARSSVGLSAPARRLTHNEGDKL